jgi:hypothetical protein
MHLVYYDESGDDGFPAVASPLFVLAAVYCPDGDWRTNFDAVQAFRRTLAHEGLLPFDLELHTRELILNKNPYAPHRIPDEKRLLIIDRFCALVARLQLRCVVTAVVKPWVRAAQFDVLDRALSYSINRIELDLGGAVAHRYLAITDQGRVAKMRQTTRRMQRINYLPSQFGSDSYRREVSGLIEDPLPKDSRESHFIQIADLLACLFSFRAALETGVAVLPRRAPVALTSARIDDWLQTLRPVLNLKASKKHPDGLVLIPQSSANDKAPTPCGADALKVTPPTGHTAVE